MKIKIKILRKVSEQNLSQIALIYKKQGWWTTSDNKKRLKKIIRGSHYFIVAEKDKEIIGMARIISDKTNDAYIQDFAVLDRYRKKGIGRKILKKIIKISKKEKFKWLGLISERKAFNFYKKLGFQEMKKFKPMIYDKL